MKKVPKSTYTLIVFTILGFAIGKNLDLLIKNSDNVYVWLTFIGAILIAFLIGTLLVKWFYKD